MAGYDTAGGDDCVVDEKLHVSAEDMPVPGQTGARIYATVPRCVEWRSGVWSGGHQTGTVPSVPPPPGSEFV